MEKINNDVFIDDGSQVKYFEKFIKEYEKKREAEKKQDVK